MDGVALEVVGPGRWVEDHAVDLGEGASATLRRGLLFPVVDGAGSGAGFVFVGAVATALPAGDDALALRAAAPEAYGPGFAPGGDLLLAVGRDPDLAAAAVAGVPILPEKGDVVYLDEAGREVVLVTDLRPRAALDEARDALRQRSWLLAGAGLDPAAMLAREAYREGPPRSITELRAPLDLSPLIPGPRRPWVTWVVDPTGLVDDAWGGVLGVHGGPDTDRTWRALGGAPLAGPPAFAVEEAAANVVVGARTGLTVRAEITTQLALTAGEAGRLVDVWIPETLDLPVAGSIPVDSDPEPVATVGDAAAAVVTLPFGPRRVAGARVHTLLLPAPVPAGGAASLRLSWSEAWDVGHVLLPREFASWAWAGPPNRRPKIDVLPETVALGTVALAEVAPTLATGPRQWPLALRAGTSILDWGLEAGAGAEPHPQEHGTLWTVDTRAPAPVAVGRLREVRAPARAGLPRIRVVAHAPLEESLLPTVRSILHFYATALPPWPHPEVVVVRAPDVPVLLVEGPVRPEADPYLNLPAFDHAGSGVLVFRGPYGFGSPMEILQGGEVRMVLPAADASVGRAVDRARPHGATRSLAEALAAASFDDLPWPARDRWVPAAIAALLRDEFVAEAWGRGDEEAWARATDELLADAPAGPFTDERWAAERGARLLHLVMARIGERDTHAALAHLGATPTAAGLAAALEAESGVSFAGLFDLFAAAGLQPAVSAAVDDAGTLTVRCDPPVGSWDVPVAVDGRLRWVPVVDGAGEVALPGGAHELEVDPEGWLPLSRPERVAAEGAARRGHRGRPAAE